MKTITIQIPVKQYYQQEFQKLKNRETGLRQKIKNTKGYIQSANWYAARIQAEEMAPTAKCTEREVIATDLSKHAIISLLNDDYKLTVRYDSTGDDRVVCLVKMVFETAEEIAERIEGAKTEIEQCHIRVESEQRNLETLEAELSELLTEIKGFWLCPIRQANLANA